MKNNQVSAALPSAGVRSVLGRGRECHSVPKHPEVLLAPRECQAPLGWMSFMNLVSPSARVVGLGMTLTVRFLSNGTGMLPVGDTSPSLVSPASCPGSAHPSSSPDAAARFCAHPSSPHALDHQLSLFIHYNIEKLEGAPCDPLTGVRVVGA